MPLPPHTERHDCREVSPMRRTTRGNPNARTVDDNNMPPKRVRSPLDVEVPTKFARAKRKRLSRKDSREQTKCRLVEATQELVARMGFAAISVEDIAVGAGYSRGAFYSNFCSKNDLFRDLLRRLHKAHLTQLQLPPVDSESLEHILKRGSRGYSELFRDTTSFICWTEARMLAARDPRFRASMSAMARERRERLAEPLKAFYRRSGARAPLNPDVMVVGLMSLIEGLKLAELAGQLDMTPDTSESVLTFFLESIAVAAATCTDQR